jgi:hypothetical protein
MIQQIIYNGLIGWCGSVPRPKFPMPPSPPDPWPWWRNTFAGIVGGFAGGIIVNSGLGYNELVATSFGALAGGRVLSEIVELTVSSKGMSKS